MIKTIKSICTLVTVATAMSSSGVMAMDRITGKAFATRSEVYATHGMAATSQPLATQVAIDILKQGGSAVDAAIAANAMLGLVEPTGSGVGGDLFAIVWSAKDKRLYGLNASGRSPKSLSLEKLKSLGLDYLPPLGPLPVSVPGAVDGWYELHNKFGKLPMADNLAPAIHYARDGFPVSELIAYYLEGSGKKLAKFPGFKETYMPNGKMPAVGDIFKNPALANTYEKIAKGGRDAFYKGDIAKSIDKYIKAQGGYLSYEDLASHSSEWIEPVSVNYRGYDVWELPPNGQGIAALQILKTMEPFDIAAMGFNSPEYVHLFVEAKKLAFADRAKFYADMAFNKVPVTELISQQYNYDRTKLIDPSKAAKSVDAGNPALQHGDTVYLTTADKDGNMVSLIQSNYRGMGSGMTPPDLGFVLQDRGQMFDLTEGRFNTYAPGKRPFHTIIPAFVTKEGKPWLSFGVMGGATQPQMHAQIVMNLIDFKMNLQEAGDAPRILHMGSTEPTGEVMKDGGYVSLESGFPVETRRELIKKGHVLRDGLGDFGGYQAIGFNAETGVYRGASESRKDGHAAGY
ncbi:gamma-glutamyltransferase [Shewanella sp. CG12_big_fil_rev_8_21_14_0_65_47_15]|uniref:gamma-glutamyltransferase n=1 Tax=Shewanella sp. CG12_big_fil_rev_8_21_14_0_65_47_15 TaxID=1975537 RepID=UPI000CB9F196|nr:gamma-glutamyltransferase [Shewanella sp. CG12_big_fil_rev_8_21_14_0_65_47_15]PIW59733.1 MAG: gamma-glutamyltransferase [Shewanella sp. CG12_big_fil_rev_8_21_14_0_65_47_15]